MRWLTYVAFCTSWHLGSIYLESNVTPDSPTPGQTWASNLVILCICMHAIASSNAEIQAAPGILMAYMRLMAI